MCSWAPAGQKQKPLEKNAGEKTSAWLDKLRNSNGSLPTSKIRLNMQRVMQNNAAVFRTQETLEEGIPSHKYDAVSQIRLPCNPYYTLKPTDLLFSSRLGTTNLFLTVFFVEFYTMVFVALQVAN